MPTPTTSAPAGRADAVTALLGRVWDDALDPGYAAAADRRASGPREQPSRRRPTVGAGLSLALVGLLLAAALMAAHAQAPAAAARRAGLLDSVATETSRSDALAAQVSALREEIQALEADALGATAEGEELAARLQALGAAAGTEAVTGPGVRVTLDDADPADPGAAADADLARVLDRDLQMVVNGLWAAGAEAISVNDQRLTSLSAIRTAGEAILVDYRPLAPPYVVEAVGDDAAGLEAAFSAGPGGRGLQTLGQTYGIRYSLARVEEMTLPAAPAVTLRHAVPEGGSS